MVHVFFHKADLDGFASCAIVRYAINEKLNMIGCHYGDSLDLSKFDIFSIFSACSFLSFFLSSHILNPQEIIGCL